VLVFRGTTCAGPWGVTLRGFYEGIEAKADEQQLRFHWKRLAEGVRKLSSKQADYVGVYVVRIREPDDAPEVAQRIDALFKNSLAETLTETEKAFQLSFVSMSEAILMAVQAVSFIIIVIIMAVMANTMTMTARERLAEYATLKALGFTPGFISRLLMGESLLIALIGGALGMALTFPLARAFAGATGTLFPVFEVSGLTLGLQVLACLAVGGVAAAWPAWKMSHIDIVQGLRHVA